jgi:uncharacterized protein
MAKIFLSLLGKIRGKTADSGPVINITPGSPEWEALCLRCGECCIELIFDEDDNLTASTMCEYLDPDTRLCRIYETRFQVCHDCIRLTGENLPRFDWLPENCGYVVKFGTSAGKRGGK